MSLHPLNQKLLRDLRQMRGQAVAILLVIAAGVATWVMARCTLESLQRTQSRYYSDYRFAEVFTHLTRAPLSLLHRIEAIPGIATVQARVVVSVKIDLPGMEEPANARIISLPERRLHQLNLLHLRSGRMIEPGRSGEVLISEGFAAANHLVPGDHIEAVINDRLRRLTVVGVALSPEFIFQIREGDLLPDDRRYGIFWMGEAELASAFDLTGAFNDLTCTLSHPAAEADVIEQLDRLTAPYGSLGAIGRSDQSSHRFIQNEMQELRGMAVMVPAIFLGISGFLLNMVVSRLIAMQREQIATLKAFGYTRSEIGLHYLKLILLLVLLGVSAGTLTGFWLGHRVTRLYTHYFHFPEFTFYPAPVVVFQGMAISAAAGLLGTWAAVRRALALAPALAMRPEPPARFRKSIMERLRLSQKLPEPVVLILRHLERTPIKSALTCCGIALSAAVLILGSFMLDALDYAIESQYSFSMREDLSVLMAEPTSVDVLHDLRSLPGVRCCEPFRTVAARLSHGSHSRRTGILGLDPRTELHRLMDIDRRIVPLPAEGIVLSEKLGEVLRVKAGDQLRVEVLEGRRPELIMPVAGFVKDFSGTAAYLDRHWLNEILQEGRLISGAWLATDQAFSEPLFVRLKMAPRVAGVTVKSAAVRSFRETIAQNVLTMRAFVVVFAGLITVGVVYNSARIALAERSREMATLRVLGFTRREVSWLLLGELGLLTVISVPLGLLVGYGLSAFVVHTSYNSELFRMPLVIDRSTYGFAALSTCAAAAGSALVVQRMLNQVDLVSVLKSGE